MTGIIVHHRVGIGGSGVIAGRRVFPQSQCVVQFFSSLSKAVKKEICKYIELIELI